MKLHLHNITLAIGVLFLLSACQEKPPPQTVALEGSGLASCIDEIYSQKFNEAGTEVFVCTEKDRKSKGRILIYDNGEKLQYSLKALTPIDEVIKMHYGKDNRLRSFCSVVYRYGTGAYFISAATNLQGEWESQSISFMRFLELDELRQIKDVSFAFHQPKVFKIDFKNPKTQQRTFAEINGKIERIDCHSCVYRN